MKNHKIAAFLLLPLLSLAACSNGGEASSIVSEASSVSSSQVSPLGAALDDLKAGFDAVAVYKGSYINSYGEMVTTNTAEEVVLKTDDRQYAFKELGLDYKNEPVDNGTEYTHYCGDEKDYLYEESINYKNEVFNNYDTTGGSRFDPFFYNPFEM